MGRIGEVAALYLEELKANIMKDKDFYVPSGYSRGLKHAVDLVDAQLESLREVSPDPPLTEVSYLPSDIEVVRMFSGLVGSDVMDKEAIEDARFKHYLGISEDGDSKRFHTELAGVALNATGIDKDYFDKVAPIP